MSVAELLNECAARDIRLSVAGEDLKVSVPDGALTPDLVDILRAQKGELIELLTAKATPYLDGSDLLIPIDAHPRYRYWAGGQSLIETLNEIGAPDEVKRRNEAKWNRDQQTGDHPKVRIDDD